MKLIMFTLLLSLVSCASKPVLYPNSKLKKVGKEAAKADIDKCMDEADEYLESPKAKKMLKSGGAGAFIGGAVGAVKGLITGDVIGSTAEGAAYGGAGGAAAGAISPDQLKRSYVNRCLGKQGYQVLGWD